MPESAFPFVTNGPVIHTMTQDCLASYFQGMSFSGAAWPSANRAFYIPFYIYKTFKVTSVAILNNTATGNVDVGIYDVHGTRLGSLGSTAIGGSNVNVGGSLSLTLSPGMYYLGVSYDGTGTFYRYTWTTTQRVRTLGTYQEDSAFPLPATATFSANTSNYIPTVMIDSTGLGF